VAVFYGFLREVFYSFAAEKAENVIIDNSFNSGYNQRYYPAPAAGAG